MGEMVSGTGAGSGSGYLARPEGSLARGDAGGDQGAGPEPGDSTGPGILVLQEWWGLTGHLQSVVDRFAEAGFVAFAPDLYHGEVTTERDRARELSQALEPDRAAGEIVAAADFVAGLPETSGETVGAVGFCMGGSLALWSVTLTDRVRTAVAFYPGKTWHRLAPKWDRFAGASAVIHCAEADGGSIAGDIQTLRAEITSAGGECELHDYPGTAHAFFNDDRPDHYHPAAAASAWAKTLDTLRSRLS